MKLRDNPALLDELTTLVQSRDWRQHLGSRADHVQAIVEIFERHFPETDPCPLQCNHARPCARQLRHPGLCVCEEAAGDPPPERRPSEIVGWLSAVGHQDLSSAPTASSSWWCCRPLLLPRLHEPRPR